MLTLDSFNNDGGIQSVCRNLAYTLQSLSEKFHGDDFKMKSLYDSTSDDKYINSSRFKGFKGNFIKFVWNCFHNIGNSDTLILSHVNLLPVAIFLKIFKQQITVILIAHGTEIWRPLSWWKTKFIKEWVVIWSVSNYTKNKISKTHNLDTSRIHVLHNCLNPFLELPKSFEKPRKLLERYGLTKNQKIILTISRITRHEHDKGYEKVLKLLPSLLSTFPDLHYIICGKIDNHELNRLNCIVELLNLKGHVTLTGFISNEELSLHYTLCDTFILPSKKEGFGIVFIEAAACGCKIISGNKDGSIEAIMNGKLGIAVDPDNPVKIIKAIRHMLKNPSLASAFKRQDLCINNFNQNSYQQKVLKLLK